MQIAERSYTKKNLNFTFKYLNLRLYIIKNYDWWF